MIVLTANEELVQFLGTCRDGRIRLLRVSIIEGNYICFFSMLQVRWIELDLLMKCVHFRGTGAGRVQRRAVRVAR